MPRTYDLFGNPEDETLDPPINDNQSFARPAQPLSVADQARQRLASIRTGADIPVGYSGADMDPSFMGQSKAFAKSIGLPTSGREYLDSNLRAVGAAGRTIGGAALAAGKLAAGAAMLPVTVPIDAVRMLFKHAPVASSNPLFEGSIHDLVQGQADQATRAGEEWEAGHRGSAIGHGLASMVPLAGPMAADAGDKLFTPQTPEAVGELAGMAAIPGLSKAVMGADYAGKLNSVREGAADVGAKIANSALPKRIEYFRRGANPGRVVAPLGAKSIGEVPDLVTSRVIEPTYSRLQSVLQSPAARTHSIDVVEAIKAGFAEEMAKAENRADPAKVERLKAVLNHHQSLAMDATGGTGSAEPSVALAIKQGIGESVDWRTNSDPVEGSVNGGLMSAYRHIDASMDRAIPASKALNHRLAEALTARNAANLAILQDKMGTGIMKKMTGLYSVPAAVAAAASGHPWLGATIAGSAAARSFRGKSIMAKGLSALGPSEAPLQPVEPAYSLEAHNAIMSEPQPWAGQELPRFAQGDAGSPGGAGGAFPMNAQAANASPGYFGLTPEQISAITQASRQRSFDLQRP